MLLKNGEKIQVNKDWAADFKKPIVYRIHESKMHKDPKTGKLMPPRTQGLEASFKVYDNKQREEVEYRYATALPGRPGASYSPEYIFFEKRGEITCDPKKGSDVELAYYLHLNKYNESGPNFDPTLKPIFTTVNKQAAAKQAVKQREDKALAEEYITKEWKNDIFMLSEIARAFDVAEIEDKTTEELQFDLIQIMDKDPKAFLETVFKGNIHLRALIVEGSQARLVQYNQTEKAWYWGEDTSKKNTVIVEVKMSDEPKTKLVSYLNKPDNQPDKEYFVTLLNKKRAGSTKTEKSIAQ
jgi:hypothetical protein